MKIERLREFTVFARHLNFSEAARGLYLTQPALFNHVANMKRELGFDLVIRGKQLSLTPAGRRLFMWAEKMLVDYDLTLEACSDIARRLGVADR